MKKMIYRLNTRQRLTLGICTKTLNGPECIIMCMLYNNTFIRYVHSQERIHGDRYGQKCTILLLGLISIKIKAS